MTRDVKTVGGERENGGNWGDDDGTSVLRVHRSIKTLPVPSTTLELDLRRNCRGRGSKK